MYNKISKLLKKENVKYWDFRRQDIDNLSVSAWNNHIKNFDSNQRQGSSIRIISGNGQGFVYSNNIEKGVKKALKIAKLMDKNTTEKREFAETKRIKKNVKSKWKIDNQNVTLEEKKKLVLKNSKIKDDKVKNCLVNYNEIDKKLLFVNSEGSEIQQNLKYTMIGASVTTKKNDKIENFFGRVGELRGYEVTKRMPELIKSSTQTALEMLNAKHSKAGNIPVVCDGSLTDVFIHEALGHAAEADQILQNSSCLKGLSGKKIAPEFINIYDDATMPNLWGSYFYDDEGIPAQKTTLIEKGILKGLMHSRETAAKLNAMPTGNARAQSASFLPQVRMSNTYIKKGKDKFEDIISNVKKGVFLKGSVGGQVDPTTGNFTFSAQEGFAIERGELKGRLKGVSLSGNTLKILNDITMISDEYEPSFAGHCGKGGQYVPVYGPCPSILIKKARVGGQ